MADLFETLQLLVDDFEADGDPPADVRRRGERMRRRRIAILALVASSVVAMVVWWLTQAIADTGVTATPLIGGSGHGRI